MADRVVKVSLRADVANYLSGMEQAARKTKDATKTAEQQLKMQEDAMRSVGASAMKMGAVAAAGLALTAKAAIDWQSAWTGVTKTVDGTPAQLEKIESGLRGLAKTLPATHSEIAAVAEAAGQLGVKADSVVAFTKVMVDLGETTNLTADEAATSIAQLMNIMQTAPGDVDRLGSSLVALGNDGASTERDIIQMAQRIAGAGKIIGLSEGEVLGFANALASVGIDAEAGGSAISRIMTDMAKAVSAGGKDLEGFASVAGMSAQEFASAFKGDPSDAIATFVEGLGKVNASGGDVFTTLSDLGQSDIRVSQALLGMANAGDLLRDSLDMGNESWGENSALLTEAEKRYATVEAQLQKTQGSINDAAISFGETLLPAISDTAEGVADFAGMMSELPEPVLAAAAGFAVLLTGVGLFGGGLLVLAPRIAATKAAMIQMDMTGKTLAKTIGKGGLLMAGIAVATTAIGGIGRVGELAASDLAKLEAAVAGLPEAGKDLDALFTGMQGTTNATNGMADAARKLTDSGLEGFAYSVNKDVWGMTDAVLGWIPAVKDMSNGITKNEAQFKQLGTTMAALAKDDLPAAREQFDQMLTMMGGGEENAKKLLKVLGDDYEAALIEIISAAGGATDEQSILNFQLGKGEAAAKLAAEATTKNAETLSEMAGQSDKAEASIAGLAEEIANFGKSTLDANSANRSFEQSVDDATETLERQKQEFQEANGTLDGFIASLDIGTQAGRDNEAALDGIASAANNAAALILTQTGSQDEANAALERGREALRNQLEQFGITGEAADVYIGKLLATPADIATRVELLGAEAAAAILDNLTRNRTALIQAAVDAGAARGAAGAAYNATGGAISGPGTGTSDSILSWLSNGEHVLTAEDVSRMGGQSAVYRFRERLGAGLPAFAQGGMVGQTQAELTKAEKALGPLNARLKDAEHMKTASDNWVAAANAGPKDQLPAARASLEKWKKEASAAEDAVKAGQQRIRDLRDTLLSLHRAGADYASDTARGSNQGTFSAVDQLRSMSRSDTYSAGNQRAMSQAATTAERSLVSLEKRSEAAAKAVEKASDKLDVMKDRAGDLASASAQMAAGIASSLRGDVSPGDAFSAASSKESWKRKGNLTWAATTETKAGVSASGVASFYRGQAGKVSAFAAQLKKLAAKGVNGALLEEIAAMGVDQGGQMATALLSASAAQISSINSSYKAIGSSANAAGQTVADTNFKKQIEKAERQIELAENQLAKSEAVSKAIQGQIKAQTDRIVNIIKDTLGLAGKHASGGTVTGIGSGTSDSNLRWLSNGEEITRAPMASKYRGLLKMINSDRLGAGFPTYVQSPAGRGGSGASMEAAPVLVQVEFKDAALRQMVDVQVQRADDRNRVMLEVL